MYIGIEAQGSVPCAIGGDLVVLFLGHLLYAKKERPKSECYSGKAWK